MSQTSEGFRPPQQARSRESLERVLTAAEQVLAEDGLPGFTIGAVAARAGLSVGAIYRRFDGKEQLLGAVKDQLLGQLEEGVRASLESAGPGLGQIVGAFVSALADTFGSHDRVFPELLDAQRSSGRDRGLAALAAVQDTLTEAAQPALTEVRRPDAAQAVAATARTIIGACVHRAATCRFWPDGRSWPEWAAESAEMALAYLTSAGAGPVGAAARM
ncbi:TetR/AcrR family transcriptional regulator [Amycolatopsis benzoatilytica]|uniref:TetR/AcrR family transcriptional regulator n=1 Tax=Amycolatopsis benzoatilytica TaxID=346045 RepID=UPI00068503ED|nr:TetR/AcrR family transcriptional regulator [Amycolatopsis benzoatilytica]